MLARFHADDCTAWQQCKRVSGSGCKRRGKRPHLFSLLAKKTNDALLFEAGVVRRQRASRPAAVVECTAAAMASVSDVTSTLSSLKVSNADAENKGVNQQKMVRCLAIAGAWGLLLCACLSAAAAAWPRRFARERA